MFWLSRCACFVVVMVAANAGAQQPGAQVIKENFQGREIKFEVTPPLAPDDALKSIQVKPGFKVELVAAEPLIVDPVAFDWGPDGRLWVVEMRDYPNGLDWHGPADAKNKPGGRVKVLRDKEGDGRYDEAVTFLDNLSFPTGIKVWRNGVLITAAPEIIYAEDTNGDDVADVKKSLFRGFVEGNQQHRVNGLRWGYDGWLYVGNGDSGGRIKSLITGDELNMSGRDLRINPDTGAMEAQSGQTQFGRERDDYGNWFGGNNSNPMWHYVLDDHYLRRNPHVGTSDIKKQISAQPGPAPVFPKSKTLARFNDFDRANRFTSACSPLIYRDNLLGNEYYGNCFICEPVHNLVHREMVEPDGLSFRSKRAADELNSEFLASTDSWFRPVMCSTGPDGALYIADMYRFVIEHPQWIPEGVQRKIDLKLGDDKGRIYRVFRENQPPKAITRLDNLDAAGLAVVLNSPHGPLRDLAQQMLVWSKSAEVAPTLIVLAKDAQMAQVRVQTLATLQLLNGLTEESLLTSLRDIHPGVRKEAVRLSEPRLEKSAATRAAVGKLAGDADLQVRLQVAYAAGEVHQGEEALAWAVETLSTIRRGNPREQHLQTAVLSSLNRDNAAVLIEQSLTASDETSATSSLFTAALPLLDQDAVRKVAAKLIQAEPTAADESTLKKVTSLLALVNRQRTPREQMLGLDLVRRIEAYAAHARALAATPTQDRAAKAVRSEAIKLLGQVRGNEDADLELLGKLLRPQEPPEIQSAALLALVQRGAGETPKFLLAEWNSHSPQTRQNILNVLLVREDWGGRLLAAVEAGQIEPSQLDAARRQTLLVHKSPELRARAEKVFATAGSEDRRRVIDGHQDVLKLAADVTRGRAVFAKRCAACHKLDEVGHDVGPNLAALSDRSPPVMLTAILDPNRAVEDKFRDYQVLLHDGRVLTGLLLAETSTSLTVAGAEGKQTTVLRTDIEQLRATGKSLMPDGLEKDLSKQDLADLLALLAAIKK